MRARAKPDMAWVNRINLNVLAPALIFSALASKDFDLAANRALMLGAIGVVMGSGLLAWPFAASARRRAHVRAADDVQQLRQHGPAARGTRVRSGGLSAMVALFTISNLLHFTLGVMIVNRHAAFWPVSATRW